MQEPFGTSGRNASIHGLRGLAVLAVFVHHVHRSVVAGDLELAYDPGSFTFRVFEAGRLGVDLFFLISGYLITASLVRHRSTRGFLWSRAVRIYPAFVPLHLLFFIAGPLIGYGWMADLSGLSYVLHFVSNLLFLPGVFNLPIAQIVAWSLSYEFAFYLLAGAARQCAVQERRLRRALMWFCWGIAAGSMLWHHPRAWFFVAGATAYALMRSSRGRELAKRLAILEVPALLLMALLFDSAFPLAVVCGLVTFLAIASERGRLTRVLTLGALQFLGTLSYSFYLWHILALFAAKRIFGGGVVHNAYWNLALFTLVSAAGSLVAAYLSWRLIEQRAWLRRWSRDPAFDREADAIAVWRQALAQTRLEPVAQSVTIEGALGGHRRQKGGFVQAESGISSGREAIRGERERGSGAAGDRTQAGSEEEDAPQETAAVCADRP